MIKIRTNSISFINSALLLFISATISVPFIAIGEVHPETENQILSTSPVPFEKFNEAMAAACGENQIRTTARVTHHYVPLLNSRGPKARACHNIEGVCKYTRNGSEYIYVNTGGGRKRQRGFRQHAFRNDKLVSQAFCKHGNGYNLETNCKHPCRSLVASKKFHKPGQVVFFPELVGKSCGSGDSAMIHDGFMIVNDSKSHRSFNREGRFDFFWGDCSKFSRGVCKDGKARSIDQLLSKSPYCEAWSPSNSSHNEKLKEALTEKIRSEALKRGDNNAAEFSFESFVSGGKSDRELESKAEAQPKKKMPLPEKRPRVKVDIPLPEKKPTPPVAPRKQKADHKRTSSDEGSLSTKPVSSKNHARLMKNICGKARRNSRRKSTKVTHYYVPLLGSRGPNASACHNIEGVCKYTINGSRYIYNYTGGGVKSNKGFRRHAQRHHKLLSRAYCKNGIGYGININCTHPCRSLAASKRHHVPGQVIFFPELVGKKCGSGKSAMIHDGLMVVNDTGSSKRFNHTGRFDFFWGDCYRFKGGVCRDGIAASISGLLSKSSYCEAWSPRNPLHNQELKVSLTNKIRSEALRRGDRNAADFDLDDFVRGGRLHRKIRR